MTVRLAVLLLPVVAAAATATAQELTPRFYAPAPTGDNIMVLSYGRSTGELLFDPALPFDDVNAAINNSTLLYGRTFGLLGRSANVAVGVPYVTEARPRTTASMLSRSQICFGEACFLRHTSTHPRSSSSTTQVDTGLEPLWRKARQVVRRRVVCPCRAWCQPGLMPGCPSGQPLESEVKAMLAWRIVMEPSYPTSEYASAFFRARGHEVSFAKPNQVKEFRKCLSPKVKTDDVDAYVIFGPSSAFAC